MDESERQKDSRKEEKRRKIREILKTKLNISNINEISLGKKQSYCREDDSDLESHSEMASID